MKRMIKWFLVIAVIILLYLCSLVWSENASITGIRDRFEINKVQVYFYNESLLGESINDCCSVYAVERPVSKTNDIEAAALRELFKGPTQEEIGKGFRSFFSSDTKDLLITLKIENRTAYINLKDFRTLIPTSCTFCGKPFFLAQVDKTIKQFGTVEKAIYAIEGNPKTFYEWMKISCSVENNNCDPKPFQ